MLDFEFVYIYIGINSIISLIELIVKIIFYTLTIFNSRLKHIIAVSLFITYIIKIPYFIFNNKIEFERIIKLSYSEIDNTFFINFIINSFKGWIYYNIGSYFNIFLLYLLINIICYTISFYMYGITIKKLNTTITNPSLLFKLYS